MDEQPTLRQKMVAYADAHELPAKDPMRRLAQELGAAVDSVDGSEAQLKKFLGAWARARRHWCEVTGEELI
jgi:hypothetical protein